MMLGPGKMMGDDEALRGCKHLTSVICHSQHAKLFHLKKEVIFRFTRLQDLLKLRTLSEEAWQAMVERSLEISKAVQTQYMDKVRRKGEINAGIKEEGDIKWMCENLMKEMLWAQIPQTIKFYEIKKLGE